MATTTTEAESNAYSSETYPDKAADTRALMKESRINSVLKVISTEVKTATDKFYAKTSIDMGSVPYFVKYRNDITSKLEADGYTVSIKHKVAKVEKESTTNTSDAVVDTVTKIYNRILKLVRAKFNTLNENYPSPIIYNIEMEESEINVSGFVKREAEVIAKFVENGITVMQGTTSTPSIVFIYTFNLNVFKLVDAAMEYIEDLITTAMESYKETITVENADANIPYFKQAQVPIMTKLNTKGYASVRLKTTTTGTGKKKVTTKTLTIKFKAKHTYTIKWEMDTDDIPESPNDRNPGQQAAARLKEEIDTKFRLLYNSISSDVAKAAANCANSCTYTLPEPFISNKNLGNEVVDRIKANDYTVTKLDTEATDKTKASSVLTISW